MYPILNMISNILPFIILTLTLPFFGLINTLSLPSLITLSPVIILTLLQLYKKESIIIKYFQLSVLLSQIGLLISYIASRRNIAENESTIVWALDTPSSAKIGFPNNNIEIPQAPLGSDQIPQVFINYIIQNQIFWLIFGIIIALLIFILNNKKDLKIKPQITILIWLISFYTIGLLFYFFD